MKTKTLRIVAVVSIAIALIGGTALAVPANAADPRYISVTATGSTTVVPDAVRINAVVSLISKSSAEALAASSTTASAVRKALVANKVSTKDLATQSVNVYPEYSYPQDGGKPVLTGYRASQSFEITIRAAKTAGAVVDAIVAAGGDNLVINGVTPYVLDSSAATEKARAAAVKNAKAKATSYARLLGVKLGKVVYLDETSTPTEFPGVYASAAKSDAATQIDLGQQKVSVSVTVRWGL
jgi:uncharacterized protein YggE